MKSACVGVLSIILDMFITCIKQFNILCLVNRTTGGEEHRIQPRIS